MADAMRPPRNVLRGALSAPAGEQPGGIMLASAYVTAVTGTTVTLRLADGTDLAPLPYLGWWAPRVGETTAIMRQGPLTVVLGPTAPAAVDTSAPPPPPQLPPPPPAQASVRTVAIPLTLAAGWDGTAWQRGDVRQGGPAWDSYFLYGGRITSARGTGTIVSGTLYVQRIATPHGVDGEVSVRVGTHSLTSLPVSPPGLSSVAVVARVSRGQDVTAPLTAAQIAALNAGAEGLGLAHGDQSFVGPDYLRAGGATGALALTIQD